MTCICRTVTNRNNLYLPAGFAMPAHSDHVFFVYSAHAKMCMGRHIILKCIPKKGSLKVVVLALCGERERKQNTDETAIQSNMKSKSSI